MTAQRSITQSATIICLLLFIVNNTFAYTAITTGHKSETYAAAPRSQKKTEKADKPKTIEEPLFGKKLSKVSITGSSLKGACFYIVSGHGGPDPGAINRDGGYELHEDEYAYDVALRLARYLMQQGAKVHIIIQDKKDGIRDDKYLKNSKTETCMGKKIPLKQTARLKQRVAKINELYKKDRKKYKYCRAIFLHVDSRSKKQNIEVHFYHAPKSKRGEQTARAIRDTFDANYKKFQPKRGYSGDVGPHPRGLYVVNNTTPAAVLIELGNIRNNNDLKRIVRSDNREALAKWIMQGVAKDYKANK